MNTRFGLRSAVGAAFLVRAAVLALAHIAADTARIELGKAVLWVAERMDPAATDFGDVDDDALCYPDCVFCEAGDPA